MPESISSRRPEALGPPTQERTLTTATWLRLLAGDNSYSGQLMYSGVCGYVMQNCWIDWRLKSSR